MIRRKRRPAQKRTNNPETQAWENAATIAKEVDARIVAMVNTSPMATMTLHALWCQLTGRLGMAGLTVDELTQDVQLHVGVDYMR